MIPVLEQWQIFLALCGAGLLLAFAFDCYRVGRYFWRPGHLSTHMGDALFWLTFTALTFTLLMFINWGEVRAYVFLALGLGTILYAGFLSRGTRRRLYTGGRLLARMTAIGRRFLRQTVLVVIIPGRLVFSCLTFPLAALRLFLRRHHPGGPPGGVKG
ncbi:Spore cortex protein YabQ [Neomoorella glycerini]|uniref:Spore cortex protein YabQ n=1 Tax=Neomoorella glycerini TaxID=55779 RepID=A0A6I5ZQ04_9FIRM|nr:spore cortex biosynthesis protein YabQ [Moorella glycerini]QGP92084.1 Spore cortex protein YabQ [Moorella glycerini]